MEFIILDSIQQLRNPVLDVIIPIITMFGNGGIFWIALSAVLLIFPKTRKTGLMMGIALLMDLLICNVGLKPLVVRIRPCDINTGIELLIARPLDYSFPSGHTAASFAASFALLFSKHRKYAWPAIVLSAMIAFSRLYLYVHYPTDVLAGIIIGLLCGFLSFLLVSKIDQFISNRKKGEQNGEN